MYALVFTFTYFFPTYVAMGATITFLTCRAWIIYFYLWSWNRMVSVVLTLTFVHSTRQTTFLHIKCITNLTFIKTNAVPINDN